MNMRARTRRLKAAIAGAGAVLVLAGCGTVVEGRALSMLNDPFRVGGLAATNGPSGIRSDTPSPTGTVVNTDNGAIDKLSLLSIDDIEDYWKSVYSQSLKGTFVPVGKLISYDSRDPRSPIVCHSDTYNLVNAFFTSRCNLIAWDRAVFMPVAQRYFGDMSVNGVLAHEFGHALQHMAKLVTSKDPTIVREQQADCFAGVYLFWVADGKSPRFTLSTADGLDHVLAGIITTRDPVMDADSTNDDEHGSALDRISAFQMGFINGASACAGYQIGRPRWRPLLAARTTARCPRETSPDSRPIASSSPRARRFRSACTWRWSRLTATRAKSDWRATWPWTTVGGC